MKTIAELESELEEVTQQTKVAWAVFKEAEKKIEPLNRAWYDLHKQQEKLGQILTIRKEMEMEAAK